MRISALLAGLLMVGILGCEQPKKAEEKTEAPKPQPTEQKAEKTEAKKEAAAAPASGGASAEDGKKIFTAKGCNACHQPKADGVGPGLHTIAKAYGSVEELVKYLKGEAPPKVWPEKAAIMNPQLAQLKGLSEAEFRALAEYIMAQK